MTEESTILPAKTVRKLFSTLQDVESALYQQATLLHRLFYKSKAQHRSAKWFQSIGGMRKCFARLLDMSNVSSKMNDSLPDRGVACKRGSRKRKRPQHDGDDKSVEDESLCSSLASCQGSVGSIWDSLWGEEKKTKDGQALTKYDTRPSHEASPECCRIAAKKLLLVCMQLEELACRARTSFQLMELHLRTPPAATFAPLVITILSVCAEIQQSCNRILWTTSDSTQMILSDAYSLLHQGSKIDLPSTPFLLNARDRNRRNGVGWERMSRKVIASGRNDDLTWLPTAIIQSRELSSDHALLRSSAKDAAEAKEGPPANPPPFDGDEDLGEAL